MKTLNRVFLMGYLADAPELKISKAGKHYSRLRVATHRSYPIGEDKWETKTDWHSVFVWGPLAERCCHDLRKGALVFVEGALSYWKVAMGEENDYKNAIHGSEVKFIQTAGRKAEMPPPMPEGDPGIAASDEHLDNEEVPRNHNAVAHPA